MSNQAIHIEVRYASGAVAKISIPWEEKAATAVSYQGEEDKGVETPAKTQEELDAEFCSDKAEAQPTGKRYASVQDLISGRAIPTSHEIIGEKEEVEGKGRIGGVGEREERGVEEEKPDHIGDLTDMVFETQTTTYSIPPKTLKDFVAAYGIELVQRELPIAKAWLATNPRKRKTLLGTGRFLNAWLSRANSKSANGSFGSFQQQAPKPAQSGSLLQSSTDSQEGW